MNVQYLKKTGHKDRLKHDLGPHDLIALRHDSDRTLKLTHYWSPPVPPWKPVKKNRNSNLRMACVIEESLYQGLRFEGEIMLLSPSNWKHIFKYGKPDFLIMESIWDTATGHWYMGQCPSAPCRDELLEIVASARKLSIPTVFWITKDHEYHEHYKNFARHFDHVFCADPREIELLIAEGVQAESLLPCVQPAVYNPFRLYDYYNAMSLDVLYDGWADLDRMTEMLKFLMEVKAYNLNIIESRYQIFSGRVDVLPGYKECILGCVTEQSRILALKYAKAYITLEHTLSTKTKQQWMSLEASASRLPVVHYGAVEKDDLRKGIVIECPEQMEFLAEFARFQEDELYRERVAHLGWRKTFQEHTFAHRIQRICKTIGIHHDWQEYPKASLITPTFRQDMLPRCLKTFEQQTYPNKELILAFNGREFPSCQELEQKVSENDIKIAIIPEDMFAGACMNQGHLLATGEYYFRIDDDDYYGSNYILDMILQARSIDADFFGKPMSIYYLLNEDGVYLKHTGTNPFMIISENHMNQGVRFSGNSVSGKAKIFQENMYSEFAYSAADSIFIFNSKKNERIIATMDNMNMIVERRKDQSTHTWKIDLEKLKKNMEYISHDINDLLI